MTLRGYLFADDDKKRYYVPRRFLVLNIALDAAIWTSLGLSLSHSFGPDKLKTTWGYEYFSHQKVNHSAAVFSLLAPSVEVLGTLCRLYFGLRYGVGSVSHVWWSCVLLPFWLHGTLWAGLREPGRCGPERCTELWDRLAYMRAALAAVLLLYYLFVVLVWRVRSRIHSNREKMQKDLGVDAALDDISKDPPSVETQAHVSKV